MFSSASESYLRVGWRAARVTEGGLETVRFTPEIDLNRGLSTDQSDNSRGTECDLLYTVHGMASHHGASASRGLRGPNPHSEGNRRHTGGTVRFDFLGRLWPGHSGPISGRVIGIRVFSDMTLSAGVASPSTESVRLNVSLRDVRPGHRYRLSRPASRSTPPEDGGMRYRSVLTTLR